MNKYEYYIDSRELLPPIGNRYYYVTKVQSMYCNDAKIEDDFGETWGRDKEEAEEKMEKKIQKWKLTRMSS